MRSPAGLSRAVAIANVAVVITALGALLLLQAKTRRDDADHPAARATQKTAPELPSAKLPAPIVATVKSARKVRANELGMVPVIMYHRILKRRWAHIDRTPSQLQKELEKLARDGYVPITAAEYVTGRIDIPAGAHPVVLSFDDGNPTHFAFDAQGLPSRDTAVGVLFEVARKYPRFRPVATFWINREPFGLKDPVAQEHAVHWLVQHGFEVANHTYWHRDLRRLSKKRAMQDIALQERLLGSLRAGPSKTFALPYGSMPKKKNLTVVRHGSQGGTRYDFSGVFLAGAEPAGSPHAKDFRPYEIPRIQSNGKGGECRRWCSAYWLEWLRRHPAERYTADGDPDHISIPKKLQGNIRGKLAKRIVAY